MELHAVEPDKKFKFKCKGCGHCCDGPTIFLYPFDVKLICDNLNISTMDFLQNYAIFNVDKYNIPRAAIKNHPSCPFKDNANKCTIYDFRPVRCRLYPVGRFYDEDQVLHILSNYRCVGFDSNKKQTIKEFIIKQGADKYDGVALKWNRFLISLKESPIDDTQKQLFKKVFFNFDLLNLSKPDNLEEFMDILYEEFSINK